MENESVTLSPKFKKWAEEAANLELESESQYKETKKDLYMKMADELLSHNFPKQQIYSYIHKELQNSIRDKKHDEKYILNNSWLYEVCQENGFTKSSEAKNVDSSDFKNELPDNEPFSDLRNQMIFIIDEMKRSLSENKKLILDKDNLISKEVWEKFFSDKSETKKFFDIMQSIVLSHIEDAMRCRDTRQIILPTDRFLVTAINYFIFDSWYCKKYHAVVKERSIITPKKLSIYKNDLMSYSHLIYHTMEDPLNLHFLDIRCPQCNRYLLKCVWNKDGTWHIVCTNEIEHNDKKPIFPASLIEKRLTQLESNKGGASTVFLQEKGIVIPDNNPKGK